MLNLGLVQHIGNSSLASSIPFSSGKLLITAKVYSPVSGINIRLKAEDHTNAGISVETDVTLSTASNWTTLVFDFSNEVSGTELILLIPMICYQFFMILVM